MTLDNAQAAEVYEIEYRDPDRVLKRLVLSTQHRVRRIGDYPSEWRALDDAALLALFDHP